MHKLKARDNKLKERKTGTNWKIVEGSVNRDGDHIKITYGEDPEPIALISRGRGNSFKVQFMLSKDTSDKKVRAMLQMLKVQLNFILLKKVKKILGLMQFITVAQLQMFIPKFTGFIFAREILFQK